MSNFDDLFKLIDQRDRALARGRKADFRLTRRINDALYGNLSAFISGRAGSLNAENRRIIGRMGALVEGMKLAGRKTAAAQQGATDAYGGMLSNAASFAFAPARSEAREGVAMAQAGKRLGGDYAATGADIMSMAGQGAEQARAGADYATAQALSARTQRDAADIANEKLQIKMMEMQQAFELQKMEKQFGYEQKLRDLEEQKLDQQAGPIAATSMKGAMVAGTQAMFKVRDYIQAHPDMSPEDLLKGMQDEGVIADPAGTALAQQMIGDPTILQDLRKHRSSAQQKAGMMVDIFLLQHPEFLKYRSNLVNIAYRHIRQAENLRLRPGGSGSGGVGWGDAFTTEWHNPLDAIGNLVKWALPRNPLRPPQG